MFVYFLGYAESADILWKEADLNNSTSQSSDSLSFKPHLVFPPRAKAPPRPLVSKNCFW